MVRFLEFQEFWKAVIKILFIGGRAVVSRKNPRLPKHAPGRDGTEKAGFEASLGPSLGD
jgi:hypothetical protein